MSAAEDAAYQAGYEACMEELDAAGMLAASRRLRDLRAEHLARRLAAYSDPPRSAAELRREAFASWDLSDPDGQ